jgi:hypothetical protein
MYYNFDQDRTFAYNSCMHDHGATE